MLVRPFERVRLSVIKQILAGHNEPISFLCHLQQALTGLTIEQELGLVQNGGESSRPIKGRFKIEAGSNR